jgi:type II secretory pathway pseudopilin PulG
MRDLKPTGGYTATELAIVLGLVAVLCAIAIPTAAAGHDEPRSAEATRNLSRMVEAARRGGGAALPAAVAITPAASCCHAPGKRCAPDPSLWTTPTWQRLSFSVVEPHLFRYAFEPVSATRFVARAVGDLDCDGFDEVYEMSGERSP